MFNKKKLIKLEKEIEMLQVENNYYKEKNKLLEQGIKMIDRKASTSIISNIFTVNDSIHAIFLVEKKFIFNNLEIEIYDVIAGELVTNIIAELYSKEELHISAINTKYKYQNLGHASRGLQFLVRYAKAIGVKYILGGLLVSDNMEYLYKFYVKNGFEVGKTSFEKYI